MHDHEFYELQDRVERLQARLDAIENCGCLPTDAGQPIVQPDCKSLSKFEEFLLGRIHDAEQFKAVGVKPSHDYFITDLREIRAKLHEIFYCAPQKPGDIG